MLQKYSLDQGNYLRQTHLSLSAYTRDEKLRWEEAHWLPAFPLLVANMGKAKGGWDLRGSKVCLPPFDYFRAQNRNINFFNQYYHIFIFLLNATTGKWLTPNNRGRH